nr:RNA-directed DNA polymerase, eukaryota [Tanacetum cinerariifolium]
MKIISLNIQGLGHKTKKEWVQELITKHKINFLAIQETKLDCISHMDVKFIWGNSNYQFVSSDSVSSSGGILCVWEASIFRKDYSTVSDNFIGIYGTWLPSNTKVLFVAVYAPQSTSLKRVLWEYISSLIAHWKGEMIVMGYFNEVRSEEERLGSLFNKSSARSFNHFISSSELVDVKMEGYSFTWSHPSATKMSKLDRFLVSEGIVSLFPYLSALCLDRHLSDHRPILLNEIHTDYGPVPFRVYHSWFKREGFDDMVKLAWNSFSHSDSNQLIKFKKKIQDLKYLDNGIVSDELLLNRMELTTKLQENKQIEAKDFAQKAKIKLAIEGDENSKFFYGIVNKRRSQLAIRGVFVDGDWHTDLVVVKDAFKDHFASRFKQPDRGRDEICAAVWGCDENKSPGPDGGKFPKGNSASFIALIPKVTDAKFVTDFRPISLIGSVYKVVTKILVNRLSLVISDLVSDTQYAFAYDSVRWDYLLDVLHAFGFGPNWCKCIQGTFTSAMASILVNGSPIAEFPFFHGLKQGEWSDANLVSLVRILNCFYLVSGLKINLQKTQVLGVGVSPNVTNHGASLIGCDVMRTPFRYLGVSMSWNSAWANTIQKLHSWLSRWKVKTLSVGGRLTLLKSVLGASPLPFRYLGVSVGVQMSRNSAWANTIQKLHSWLSRWKVKTLSVGGRLTLLKSVLGASPLYNLSIYKAPKGVLPDMESIRSTFFNGVDPSERKITWVTWEKVLASKKNSGLGVPSFHTLNRALLLKWVWRFLSQDGSIWSYVISAIYGPSLENHQVNHSSSWCSILQEARLLASKGFGFVYHCKKRVGDGQNTQFWSDTWISDLPLCVRFPRLFALEEDKEVSVASKLGSFSVDSSFRRPVRDVIERQQWSDLSSLLESVATRWVKYIPIKINIFRWRARLDCIPTRCNLASRGVVLESSLCPLCGLAPKDASHVLFRCELSKHVLLVYVVKENQEKDKIGSKPDKNGKRGEAGKSQKQLQLKEEEKPKKTRKEWPKTHARIKSY